MSRSRRDGKHGGGHVSRRRAQSLAKDGRKLEYGRCGCCEWPRLDAGDRAQQAAEAAHAEWQRDGDGGVDRRPPSADPAPDGSR